MVQFQLSSVEPYQGTDFQSCSSIKCASFDLEKLPIMWVIYGKYLVYDFSLSTKGRLFPLLGLEAAQLSPQDNKGAAAAHSFLFPLFPHSLSLFFNVLSFCTGSASLCIWMVAGEQQLCLCGSRAVVICASPGRQGWALSWR